VVQIDAAHAPLRRCRTLRVDTVTSAFGRKRLIAGAATAAATTHRFAQKRRLSTPLSIG